MINTQIVQSKDVTTNFSTLARQALAGETIIVSRPHKENVAIISETKLTQLLKMLNNSILDQKIDQGLREISAGRGVGIPFEALGIDF